MDSMHGVLEVRPPGIIGKWEEHLVRLDSDALRYYSQRHPGEDAWHIDGALLGEFHGTQIDNIVLDTDAGSATATKAQELRFTVQGKQWRLRYRNEDMSREWFSNLQAMVDQAKNEPLNATSDFHSNGNFQGVMKSVMSSPGMMQSMEPLAQGASKSASSDFSPRSAAAAGKSRLTQLYDSHQKKLEKLEDKRTKEADAERKKWEESFAQIKSKSQKRITTIDQKDAKKTADRLFNEHKYMQQRLADKRSQFELEEMDKIHETRRMNLPTRYNSEPGLLSSREAGDRLYSDAERRELWRQQARDAQAKEEMMMVNVGVKTNAGSRAASMNHCINLYKHAKEKQDKLKRDRERIEKEKEERLAKESVKVAKKYNPDRINLLHTQHQARLLKTRTEQAKNIEQEQRELEKARVKPRHQVRQAGVPWKDPNYPYNLPKKHNNASPSEPTTPKTPTAAPISHADIAMKAIVSAITLRCGYHKYEVRSSEREKMVEALKKAMHHYAVAHHTVQQDSGYASLCSRASLKLFQAHLLPEVEGWAHRLEPDPIRQVEDDLDSLYTMANKAQDALKEELAPGMQWAVGSMRPHPAGVPSALWAFDPGLKPRASSETKALVNYAPGEGIHRYRHLLDISRLQITFATCEMLQSGLEHILRRFEVVDVRNYFGNPGRLGMRFVEVLVVMIVRDGKDQVPHVCELRLEPQCYSNAARSGIESMRRFSKVLREAYMHAHMDLDAVEYIAHNVLHRHPEGHRLRSFRCNLNRRFGSTVCSWRRALGGSRLLSFQRFREVCYSLHYGEHVTELWQELDPGRGGCISLWELDAEATALLSKLRSRMVAAISKTGESDLDGNDIIVKLSALLRPAQQGVLERHEFRNAVKPLGLNAEEADRAFACLDHFPSSMQETATIDGSDISWLKKLTSLVDTDAVECAQDPMGIGDIVKSRVATQNELDQALGDLSSPLSGSIDESGTSLTAWETPRQSQQSEPSRRSQEMRPPAYTPPSAAPNISVKPVQAESSTLTNTSSYAAMKASRAAERVAANEARAQPEPPKVVPVHQPPAHMDLQIDGVDFGDDDEFLEEEGEEEEDFEDDEEEEEEFDEDQPDGEETW